MRLWKAVCTLLIGACCAPSNPESRTSVPGAATPAAPAAAPVRVLMLTATAGFRHDSIATARDTMTTLAAQSNAFTVVPTENVGDLNASTLGSTDVVWFSLTSGELPLSAAQRDAMIAFVNSGGGFIGIHSAADTLYEWPDYGRLVGAYFKEHPWTQEAVVTVEDGAHAITAGVGPSFRLLDEFYTFRQNPRSSVHVLLSLEAASVGTNGDFPLAWTQNVGRGRSYYNALGHFESTWRNPAFQRQLLGAVRWAGQKS